MYITLNKFSPVIISCLVYMLYDDKLYMLKSINKVSVLFYHVSVKTNNNNENKQSKFATYCSKCN